MARVETVSYTNETFKSYLMRLSKDLVWKNSSLANLYEKNTDPYLVETYISANRGVLNFNIIRAFPRDVLKMIGIPENKLDECAANKYNIPENMRKYAVDEYQTALCSINPSTGHNEYETVSGWVDVYEEQNDYYRMLNGLPSINTTNYIYNTDPRWPTDIPIHKLPLVDRLEMEDSGILEKLYNENPNAEYLKYCGSKSIPFYKSRAANRFDILWRNTIESNTLEEDFDAVYASCCNLVNSVYYSDAFRKTNKLYENFLAMCILFMTIQTMQYHYLSVDVIRDFYDTESLKYVYDSYSVPFYNEIPLEYHRKIVKNINKLIGYKGSSQVFFDLFDIFNINMNIYTYYLTKVHKFDEDGNPLFTIKVDEHGMPLHDKNGNPILSPTNYDIAFAKGEIYEDVSLSIADPVNRIDYDTITAPDPYWIEDKNLKDTLNEESFNFNETKYIGVQTTFDLIKIAYENAYVFKMIVDNKSITDRLNIQWPDMGIETSLYNIFIYLAALACKYHGYDGLLSSKLPYTASVLGYNFQKSVSIIKDVIDKNVYLRSNTKLKEKIRKMTITNVNSVDSTFGNMQEIEKMLISGYINSTNRDEFNAYRDLYDTLMTSKIIDEVYTTTDGVVAESFSDLLRSKSPDLYARLFNISQEDIENELTVLIDKIEELITSLKYSPHSLGIESSSLIENLFRILRFFKSAKAEMIGYNIIYKITSRGVNFFKIMDEWVSMHYNMSIDNDTYIYDFIVYIQDLIKFKKELLLIRDKVCDETTMTVINDKIDWTNDLLLLVGQMYPIMTESANFNDFIIKYNSKSILNDKQDSNDKLDMIDQVFIKGDPVAIFKEPFNFLDKLITTSSIPYIIINLDLRDFITEIYTKVTDIIKLNKENIMQHDELKAIYNEEYSSIFNEYILKEIKSKYSGITVDSKLEYISKLLANTMNCEITDIAYDNGMPGTNGFVGVSYKQMTDINEGTFMSDNLTLSDGTPL